jgi:hypothetical protein
VAGDRSVLLGLLIYLLVAATPTLFVWVAVRWLPPAFGWFMDLTARRRRPPPRPSLESVVGHVRRLRREMRCEPANRTRRVALLEAYDRTLLELCGIVGVDAPLAEAGPTERAFARLLTEAQVEDAGIALDPPSGANRP